MSQDEVYELYAIRYASHPGRRVNQSVLFYDPHNGPMPMDYFVWLARSPKRCVLIDLGYQEELAAEKEHTYFFNPVEGVKALGVAPDQVDEIIVSTCTGIMSAISISSRTRAFTFRTPNSPIAAASTCSMRRCASRSASRT